MCTNGKRKISRGSHNNKKEDVRTIGKKEKRMSAEEFDKEMTEIEEKLNNLNNLLRKRIKEEFI